MRWPSRRLLLAAVLAAIASVSTFSGCASEPPNVASLEFASQDIENGMLPIRKDGSALVGVVVRDGEGHSVELDASEFVWESDDPALDVKGLGNAALITGKADWFDTVPDGGDPATAHEPRANLIVTYHQGQGDEVSASIPVAIVLNAAGRWHASVSGLGDQTLTLDQHGRHVSYTATTGDLAGTIDGDQFTLSQQGFMLVGTFTSREAISGTYTGPGGVTGTWSASRE
ncbi:MAG TPA: hypothetical protein VL426_01980 [Candidatus Binatia bacterium]|jgi:hypothetical protein|nr:hypothetical protein [Candidatus Binatia bacterium]